MNTVKILKDKAVLVEYQANDLIGSRILEHPHTAFVGSVGGCQGLFLITYECIVLAENPNKTWNDKAPFKVDHFCDVRISEV